MSLSKNYRAYEDVRIAFDRALDSDNGIKIPCKDRGEAVHLRSRFNQYRAITQGSKSRDVYRRRARIWPFSLREARPPYSTKIQS